MGLLQGSAGVPDSQPLLTGRGNWHTPAALVRPEVRRTAAHRWLRPPDDLLLLLEKWRESCSRGAG